jgi:hypothetical protein
MSTLAMAIAPVLAVVIVVFLCLLAAFVVGRLMVSRGDG